MPFYTELSTCIHRHSRETGRRFDPVRSDSNFPAFFCSLKCEKEWMASSLANLTLADVFDIQARARVLLQAWRHLPLPVANETWR
jgi:hypothetical protein